MTHFDSYIRMRLPSGTAKNPTYYIPIPPGTVSQLLKSGKSLKDLPVSVVLED